MCFTESQAMPIIRLSCTCGLAWLAFPQCVKHACRLPEAAPEVAHPSHTNLPRRGEQWRQSADVTAFLQKGHVHFADSVRFHLCLEVCVSLLLVFDMAELGKATTSRFKPAGAPAARSVCTDGCACMSGLVEWCQSAVG